MEAFGSVLYARGSQTTYNRGYFAYHWNLPWGMGTQYNSQVSACSKALQKSKAKMKNSLKFINKGGFRAWWCCPVAPLPFTEGAVCSNNKCQCAVFVHSKVPSAMLGYWLHIVAGRKGLLNSVLFLQLGGSHVCFARFHGITAPSNMGTLREMRENSACSTWYLVINLNF